MVTDGLFLCPHCGHKLLKKEKSLICENGHCFDVAKSGYVNLLPANKKNSVNPGDNKDMIKARVRVMDKGYYSPLADRIIDVLKERGKGFILDAGCGTGYITHRLKAAFEDSEIAGTDISKFAIEQASKLYKEVNYAVCSSIRLPFEDGEADAVICAFAPVYASEFARVSKENGLLLRVTPARGHLYGLKEFLYEEARYNEEDDSAFDGYEEIGREIVGGRIECDGEDVRALVKMTPYYYHTPKERLEKLYEVDKMTVETEFELGVFKKK